MLTLSTIVDNPKTGSYATLPLFKQLSSDREYTFSIKFKIRTNSNIINFHIKDSGSNNNQLIHSEKLDNIILGSWVIKKCKFIPNTNFYDEFMIGASQVFGIDNYIAFEYIYIY